MALAKSIKMYLTIFVATTCVYMVLYQYHVTRSQQQEELPSSMDIVKKRQEFLNFDKSTKARSSHDLRTIAKRIVYAKVKTAIATTTTITTNQAAPSAIKGNEMKIPLSSSSPSSSIVKQYNLLLWSPLSLFMSSSSSSSSSLKQQEQKSHSTMTSSPPMMPPNASVLPTPLPSQLSPSSALAHGITSKPFAGESNTATPSNLKDEEKRSAQSSYTSYHRNASANVAQQITKSPLRDLDGIPPLYIITPTYRRVEQLADLTRLGYTLKHVTNLLWLVIEDANKTSQQVLNTLDRIGVPYEYLLAPMPDEYKKGKKVKPRGVSNRNRGLKWLRAHANDGVFYFADDDNTYDIAIFEQMRYTKKVSMWPVGLVTRLGVSTPIVKNKTLTGFYDGWIGGRKYPVDMAGFAVSVKFLHERPKAEMPYRAGYEEDGFLKSLAPLNMTDIELLADNCTEILTWHTQTKKNNPAAPINMTVHRNTNLIEIDKKLVRP